MAFWIGNSEIAIIQKQYLTPANFRSTNPKLVFLFDKVSRIGHICIYQILLRFDALFLEEFSYRDKAEAFLPKNRDDLVNSFYCCLITLEVMEKEDESILCTFSHSSHTFIRSDL